MTPAPACPKCHGKGYTSLPYIMGLPSGDIMNVTYCDCEAGVAALAAVLNTAKPSREGVKE